MGDFKMKIKLEINTKNINWTPLFILNEVLLISIIYIASIILISVGNHKLEEITNFGNFIMIAFGWSLIFMNTVNIIKNIYFLRNIK